MLSCKVNWSVNGSYTGARGRVTGSGTLNEAGGFTLSDGTAAGQADGLFSASPDIAAGEVQTFSLGQGLQDLYGAMLDFAAMKVILIEADPGNTADLIVGGGTWAGPFGDPSNTVAIKPGCAFMMACQDANGWSVPDGQDELQITCAAAGSYGLTLVGVSSAISAPAFATAPAIIGAPTVGQSSACTPGDWSGSPLFAYQWTRNGVAISGATSAASPVWQTSDVGAKVVRWTMAYNTGGVTRTSTAPMVVQAAAAAPSDLDPTAGTTTITAVGG